MTPYSRVVWRVVQNPDLNRAVKPHLIATAVGPHFSNYLVYVLTLVGQASATTVPVRSRRLHRLTSRLPRFFFVWTGLKVLYPGRWLARVWRQLDDDDLVDFLYELRFAIMEAYTGIVQGFAQCGEACGTGALSGPGC